jgi:signal transduction histidine kinase
VGGKPVGILSLNTIRAKRDWPVALVKRLQMLAHIFANALARKQADQELRERETRLRDLNWRLLRAHEEERARLARELHDDFTQRLAVLAIDTGRLESTVADVPVVATMRKVREGLVRLSEDVHALSYRLHPALLEDLGLAEALKVECEQFSRREGIPVNSKLRDVPEPLPRDAALCFFRVTQEALRNVGRHAKAGTVEVSLWPSDGGLQLSVRDNGAGFDLALDRQQPSLGLASMRERVDLLGGELDIESAPGQGTNILAWLPLKAEPS